MSLCLLLKISLKHWRTRIKNNPISKIYCKTFWKPWNTSLIRRWFSLRWHRKSLILLHQHFGYAKISLLKMTIKTKQTNEKLHTESSSELGKTAFWRTEIYVEDVGPEYVLCSSLPQCTQDDAKILLLESNVSKKVPLFLVSNLSFFHNCSRCYSHEKTRFSIITKLLRIDGLMKLENGFTNVWMFLATKIRCSETQHLIICCFFENYYIIQRKQRQLHKKTFYLDWKKVSKSKHSSLKRYDNKKYHFLETKSSFFNNEKTILDCFINQNSSFLKEKKPKYSSLFSKQRVVIMAKQEDSSSLTDEEI